MSAGFTPGPWERRVNEDNSVIRIEAAVAEDYRRVIGYVSPHTLKSMVAGVMGRDDGTNFANARLIAAAPALYEALDGVEDRFRYAATMYHDATRWAGEDSPDPELSLLDYVFAEVRAALKLARGEEA